jgi:hypothetical protein
MELTYKVKGADGKDYGPVSHERLLAWMREGRVSGNTEVMRSDVDYWAAASQYSELQLEQLPTVSGAPNNPASAASTAGQASPEALAHMKSSASWFYWIAALSLVNSIAALTGTNWRFILGLGITQIIDAVGHGMGGPGKIVALILDLIVAGIFVLFGVFAHKRQTWAFVIGMVLFGLDGAVFLLAQDWLGVGFHIFVLFFLFRGLKACMELNRR